MATSTASTEEFNGVSFVSDTRPRALTDRLEEIVESWARSQYDTEVVVHVTSEGNTLDGGTPLSDSVVAGLIPEAFISALIYDAEQNSIDAADRRRHPSRRQKRLVKARDQRCTDCGRADLLEYDHVPAFEQTGHTITTELELRCAPCHSERHRNVDC